MENQNLHNEITAMKDGSATERQVNYLVSLYKDAIKKSITKSMKGLDKNNDYINFGKPAGALRGKFAIHAWNSFIPSNHSDYTKNKVSTLISNALNKKFDRTFAKALATSCNTYTLEARKSKQAS